MANVSTAAATIAVVTVHNQDDAAVVVQARPALWTQRDERDQLDETHELLVTPPLFTLPPKGEQTVRVALLRKPDPSRELDYRLVKSLWAFDDRRIAVRFQYEWHDDSGQWFRSYGNELWEFDDDGLMRRREASINDVAIAERDRKFNWPAPSPRPADHPGIPDVA